MSDENTVVGVDISKDFCAVCIIDSGEKVLKQYDRKVEKYADLAKDLKKLNPRVVILEATGGYEKALTTKLAAAGVPFRVIDPKRARKYADSIGFLSKTDKEDARLLALYGLRNSIEPRAMASEKELLIREYMDRRRQLVSIRADETKRQRMLHDKKTIKSVKVLLKLLDSQIKELDAAIDEEIGGDDELNRKEEVITSVAGVGDQTARTIISSMPELGTIGRREAASLAGLAPYACDSGKYRGLRRIRGGRTEVRNVLYMAALSAIKHNSIIKTFYERLIAVGKKPKSVIVACMRKLLLIINALLKKNELFEAKKSFVG